MNLIISFSGRAKGNCDSIAEFISNQDDEIICFRDKNIHACSNCEYECFNQGSYGEMWSVRNVLRRFVWHDRIHAKAMWKMAKKTFVENRIEDVFFFG